MGRYVGSYLDCGDSTKNDHHQTKENNEKELKLSIGR